MMHVPQPGARGRTPVAIRKSLRRPPTGCEFPTGGPTAHLKETVKGLGSTLQKVSDDMVGRHVAEGKPARVATHAQTFGPSCSSWWESTHSRTMGASSKGSLESKGLVVDTKQAILREAVQERKVGETFLQCGNHRSAQKHLSQSARLFQLAQEADERAQSMG